MSGLNQTALVIVDLQNDFLHPDGAYARGGQTNAAIAALPARVERMAKALRSHGGSVVTTHFTLVEGRDGEPMVSPHLKALRPFLRKGDFRSGAWGHEIVDELKPADFTVEKINYSAFYMTRLEWILRKTGLTRLVFAGIVTNGGVASTVRDAHVRDFDAIVLDDGCAAFSENTHRTAIDSLRPVARVMTISECMESMGLHG